MRSSGLQTTCFSPAARVARNAASLEFVRAVFRLIPVRSPLPNVSNHVEKSVTVCGKDADGRGSLIAIAAQILPGKIALPGIGHVVPAMIKLFTPSVGSTVEASSSGELPFCFGRQFFSGPFGISFRVAISDMDDWMLCEPIE